MQSVIFTGFFRALCAYFYPITVMNLSLREFSVICQGIFGGFLSSSVFKKLFSSGFLLVALLLSFEGTAQTTQTYNASGVFSVPAGVTSITVEAWGAGGGGGNSNNTNGNGGAGGGGGAYARKVLTGLIPGTSFTVTVGTGGTGASANSTADATDGGDSRFEGSGITTVVAGGGKLGDASGENTNGTGGNNTGGDGGTATGGDVNYSGGNGGNGGSASGGGGGSSATTSSGGANGGAGDGNNSDNAGGNVGGNTTDGPGGAGEGSNNNQDGGNGTVPGGGGGGSNDDANSAGGSGADGRVVVTYTVPGGAPTTYYSKASGNWNTAATWTTSPSHTGANAGPPAAGDAVVIGMDHNVSTNNGSRACLHLAINGSGVLNISNNNNTVTVSGNLVMDGTSQIQGNNANRVLNVGGNLTVPASATDARISGQTVTITGTTTVDGTLTLNNNTGVKTFTGAVTNSGSWTSTAVTTAGNLVFSNDVTSPGTLTAGGVTFNGSANQTLSGAGTFSFTDVTLNKNGTNLLINQNISVSGAINWSSNGLFVVDSYSNMTLGSGATITAPDNNRYIQLDGSSGANSQLIRTSTNNVSSLRIVFPVGTSAGGYTRVDLQATNAVTGSNPDNNSTLAVKPIYAASATGKLRRTFRLTVNGNDNNTTLTNARFYYNAASDVSGGDNISSYNTIWFLNSNTGSWANVPGTAPGGSGYFTASSTAQPLSDGSYYYTIGISASPCSLGDQNEYGINSWIGHVYDGTNNFQSANYLGRHTETQNFDENFGGDNVNFPLGTGCQVTTETYSVRFRMALNVTTCGVYPITIGGDDGVRLSVDGGATWETNALYNDHSYAEVTQDIYLDAGINYLVLEYYENMGQNRVRFNMGAMTGVLVTGGKIGSDQTLCTAARDPALLTSISAARNCAGNTPTYQWQYSSTSNFASVTNVGTNSPTYDPPSLPVGTHYYRRRAVVNGVTVYSNTITILAESPTGDQITAGTNTWIGYVYDGADNFTTNYLGYITENQIFNEVFCGDNCIQLTTGCRFNTETYTVRYRMNFTPATSQGYTFTIGADDGVRLSLDGGLTYVLSDWSDHGYQEVTSGVIDLFAGTTYSMVLDYYERGGGNRVSFSFVTGPLPVTWSFLDGYHTGGNNIIEWRTATEKNNSGFVVERSFDGVQFDSIGYVAGNGTTLLSQAYDFVDAWPGGGWNYYRLKQIDYDKAFEYSKIIPVYAAGDGQTSIYPNPASSSLYISHGASNPVSDAHLLNAQTGQAIHLMHDEKQPARYLLDGIPAGTYVVSFTLDGRRYTEKVIVVK